jgi:type IV secretory pathway VirB10-like protein
MPDSSSSSDALGFLSRKIGPAPVWLWGLGIAGGYYWWTHYGPGKATTTTTSTSTSTSASTSTTTSTGTHLPIGTPIPGPPPGTPPPVVSPPPVIPPPKKKKKPPGKDEKPPTDKRKKKPPASRWRAPAGKTPVTPARRPPGSRQPAGTTTVRRTRSVATRRTA